MKAISRTLLLLAGMSLLLAGCQKEGRFDGGKNAIRFTASAGSAATKTAYGDYFYEDANHPQTPTWQRLDWVVGDKIRIWSPQALDRYHEADGKHYADYKVSEVLSPDGHDSRARIINADIQVNAAGHQVGVPNPSEVDNVNGLLWGEESSYDFYAIYSSPVTAGLPVDDDGNVLVSLEPVGDPAVMTFTGVVPAEQGFQTTANPALFLPDMRLAYMTAKAEGVAPNSDVVLPFYPKFTAFEFTVSAGDFASVTLNSMTLTATDGYLTGTYVVRQDDFGAVVDGVLDADVTGGGKTVTVDFGAAGITIQQNAPASVSVIVLPQTVSGLTVSFTGVEIGARSLELKTDDGPIEFAPYRKHRIMNLRFPAMMDVIIMKEDPIVWDGEYWSSAFADNIVWDGEYTGDAVVGDPINWTSDPGVVGPFAGWYLTKGYLAAAGGGYTVSGDDQMEIVKYYGEGSVQHYFPWSAGLAAATAAGYDAAGYGLPTQAQWADILGTARTGATINNLTGKHFAKVTVDITGTEYEDYGIAKVLPPVGEEEPVTIKVMTGLLLFPDGADIYLQEILEVEDVSTVLDNPADDFTVAMTYDRLQKLCGGAQGCAFLPCAGYYSSDWTGTGTAGNYWSATGTAAHAATVQPDVADPAANRFPVRLVKALN